MTRASDLAKLLGAGATINDGTTISTADNDPQLILKCTDTDASTGPKLDLERNPGEAGADGDNLAQINFYGYNDASEKTQYLYLFAEAADVANGSEDVRFGFGGLVAGADSSLMTFMHGTSATGADPEMVFNDSSKDINFRVESNNQANMLFVDGGNDTVSFQPNSASLTIKAGSADATNNIRLEAGGTTSTYLEYRGYLGHRFYVDTTEYMQINANGYVTMSNQPAFFMANTGNNSAMKQGTETVDKGGHWNNVTGNFIAPVDGTYYFYLFGQSAGNGVFFWGIQNNGSTLAAWYNSDSSDTYHHASCACVVNLSANDAVTAVKLGSSTTMNTGGQNGFLGYLIS